MVPGQLHKKKCVELNEPGITKDNVRKYLHQWSHNLSRTVLSYHRDGQSYYLNQIQMIILRTQFVVLA